jgi:hypothetical protein
MKMVSYKHYVAGWLDSTIHDFLTANAPSGASSKYALITCLDSNPTPANLLDKSPELKSIANKASVLGTALILPTDLLLEAISRQQIFFGFDEVWFFPTKRIERKPKLVSLVGPTRIDQPRLDKFGKWMLDNNCSMGLGGGEGLNFIVQARGLVRYLIGHSIDQRQPSFGELEVVESN